MRSAIAAACALALGCRLATAAAQPTRDEHAAHAPAAAVAAPVVAAAERAAGFPDLGDMSIHETMLEDPLNKLVVLDRLEAQGAAGGDVLHWDLDTWIGRDLGKVWIRSEGERRNGDTERADLELLWGNAFARWWELVAGARADFAPGADQEWAAVGVRGLAPYGVRLEATAYLGNGGRTELRVDTRYELLVTNRLILEPSLELEWRGEADPERGLGSGLSEAALGLRLRYEIRREAAPYLGLVRARSFGSTADFMRAAGRDPDDTRLVAGVRVWF